MPVALGPPFPVPATAATMPPSIPANRLFSTGWFIRNVSDVVWLGGWVGVAGWGRPHPSNLNGPKTFNDQRSTFNAQHRKGQVIEQRRNRGTKGDTKRN